MFLICLKIIAKYSAMLEPVTQQLQAVDMDMMVVRDHIDLLMKGFRAHRDGADGVFSEDVIPEVRTLACRRTWHRLDYASAMRTPVPPADCGRVH